MNKLVAFAALPALALSLAACGGSDAEGEGEVAEDSAEGSVLPENSAGTYTGADAEGAEVVWMLSEDGSYEASTSGEVTQTGTWEDNIRGTCLTADGGDGEACFNIQPAAEEGMFDVTGPDGETMSMAKEG